MSAYPSGSLLIAHKCRNSALNRLRPFLSRTFESNINIHSDWHPTEKADPSGNASGMYSGDEEFESRPGHRLSWNTISVVFLRPSRQTWQYLPHFLKFILLCHPPIRWSTHVYSVQVTDSLNNCMELSPSLESSNCSTTQEVTSILRNTKVTRNCCRSLSCARWI
jgi:hypothetical protein